MKASRSTKAQILFLLGILGVAGSAGPSRSDLGWFRGGSGGLCSRPFLAEPRAPVTRLTFASLFKSRPITAGSESRFGMDASLAHQVPLLAYSSQRGERARRVYLDVSIDIGWHMLWDVEAATTPVIDTDYRYSKAGTWRISLEEPGSFGCGLLISPYMHESSHVGDDYMLLAQRSTGLDGGFRQVDVTTDFLMVAATVGKKAWSSLLRLRFGYEYVYSKLWLALSNVTVSYDDANYPPVITTRDELIANAENRDQFFAGLEWQRDLKSGWQSLVAIDLRRRPVYRYVTGLSSIDLERAWSTNTVVALRAATRVEFLGHYTYFVRYYRGVNPSGQFRDQKDFWLLGAGIAFTH